MTLEIGLLRGIDRGIREAPSLGATVTIPNTEPQQPLIVAELIARESVATMRDTTTVGELDYDFLEGWRSKSGVPGFVIFGRNTKPGIPGSVNSSVVIIRYNSQNLADTTDLPERFFTGPEPVPPSYKYTFEFPINSPLGYNLLDPDRDWENPHKEILSFLENLAARPEVLSRIVKPQDFYQQFEGGLERTGTFSAQLREELQKPDSFTLDNIGRYLIVVTDSLQRGREFHYGHFRGASEGQHSGVRITSSHHSDLGSDNPFLAENVLAIYGKGLTPLYTV